MRRLMSRGFLGCLMTGFFVAQIFGQEVKKIPAPEKASAPLLPATTKNEPKPVVTGTAAAEAIPVALAPVAATIPVAVPVTVPVPVPTAVPEAEPVSAPAVTEPITTPVIEEEAEEPTAEVFQPSPGPTPAVTEIAAPVAQELTVPAMPEPQAVIPEKIPTAPVASEEFDTSKIKEYGGNWYFKRAWWQNAEGEYEKARQVLGQLFEARMSFYEKRNELERTLFEPLYRNMGFEQGELQDTLVYLIDQIESERAEEGTLNIKEREFLTTLQEEKKTLEQLKLDMDQLSKFDDAIDDAVNMLVKEINQARQYEQAAWKEFKAIAEDLSDIKARERYYAIRTLYKDIKNIYDYVRGDFKRYFDKLEDDSRKEAERIKLGVKELKNKGIDLKEEAKKLTEIPAKPAPQPTPVKIEEQEHGYIMGTIYAIGGFFKSAWNLIFGWIYRF